ncbi:Ig-like domain-containing protein [Microbacterium sp. ASV81]|uniref:Ig-like domain-containing protein n=1 Tax=Microbacterium capsulatum TaxID=3041921 RepID=A0ABU0XEB9_9MICO|nr:Ig-like domain-containing protein [Microbacterium sp. ASV81]MDQ4213462.1 Ig-like domain-containing protein [Microbacterium sp. ASV81]
MSRLFRVLRERRAMLASGATLTAAAVTISTLAVLYQGIPTADLRLDDGGVWVTKSNDLLVGHLNYPSRLLDGALRTTAPDYDVLQDGNRVVVVDRANGVLSPIDPASNQFTGQQAMPGGSTVVLGGAEMGVLGGGRLYAVATDRVVGARFDKKGSLATVGDGGVVAIAHDGSFLYAVAPAQKKLVTVDTASSTVRTETLDGLAADAQVQLAAVGDIPVVFDARHGVLVENGRTISIPKSSGARLQQTSADGDAAYLATGSALIRQPLDGSAAQILRSDDAGGAPSPPVWLNGCAYAVWGNGAYVRRCDGQPTVNVKLDMPAAATPVLRVNRRVVVVNDTRGGMVWVVSTKAQLVQNWDDVVPPPDDKQQQDQSEEQQQQLELPKRSAENHKPTARDDSYGVRPGRTSVLRVTENDTDPDGDLLSASLVGAPPSGMTVTPVLGGAALQVAVPAAATGTASFRYQVDDGRGGTDQATVTLTIHPLSENSPPVLESPQTIQVEAGASITYDALQGWKDPDGDDLFLQHAEVAGGDVVTTRTNGVMEFRAASGATGIKDVALTVSDGQASTTGVLKVDVRPKGSLAPIANADHYTATAGTPITLSPLDNDISRSGEPLRLARNDYAPGAKITPNYTANTLTFEADAQGTYYVQYLVTSGAESAAGLIRIDVAPAGGNGHPPIAVRDTALLPTGRNVLVDVLANDEDPGGGVLVVQSVHVPPGSPVSAEVLDHSVVRVTDIGGLHQPMTIGYTISDGLQSAEGEILVVPVPLPATLRPPVSVPDNAVVRVGDVVSVDVLANDYSPDNDTLTLLPDLVDTKIGDGAAFVDGSRVRFQAGSKPGPAYITYQVTDSQGNRVAGYLTVQVLAADAATNSAPLPKPVIARAIAGTTVRIPIPLDGIDPDGDSVELVGTSSSPSLGRVTVGDAWLTYTAYDTSQGRDSFTYVVRDRLGATAESTVTVGVAPPGADNQAPYAVKDVVDVRPGRTIAVPVMANDSDPDGDQISLVTSGLTVPSGIKASIAGGRVVVTAPAQPGQYTLTYTIADVYGATAQAPLLLNVSSDAPLKPPIARDDHVPASAVMRSDSVKVSVLQNDENPDGTTDQLTVTAFSPNAKVLAGGIVEVKVAADPQVIRYEDTDQDGLTAQAFIFVPGTKDAVPTVTDTTPIVVKSGESVSIVLADHVMVRSGRTPRIAVADSLRAGHADGAPLLKDAEHLQYTSAKGYFGPDAVGVRVTDGTGPDDPQGLSAYVTIPILVQPLENQSPTLRNAAVSLAPGEAGLTLDLKRLTTDPDEGDLDRMSYAIEGSAPNGIDASISGSALTVKAASDLKPGATLSFKVTADDGKSKPGEGVVTISIVTTQRPMPVANDDLVPDAKQGVASVVDVLANDFNPFQGEKPLTIVSVHVDTPGSHTATIQDGKVSVTPASDFFGTLIVTYRIADATNSPDRQAEAKIVLTVRGKPGAPGVPTVTSIQDRTVVLSWAPPSNNGSPITGYVVTSQNGYSKNCASTTCTLDGLTNNVVYRFQVVAVNAIGSSDPSPTSADARPDARPDMPAAPTLAFGDKKLAVSWTTPNSNGSPVTNYDLQITPQLGAAADKLGVSGNSLSWDGLQNGVSYQVRIRAHNLAPDPSDWSAWSAPMVPAGVPDAPGQPQASFAPSVGSQAQLDVTWQAVTTPRNNGDEVATYTVTATGGDGQSRQQTVSGSTTSAKFSVGTSTSGYTFTVVATNKAGSSAPSPASAPMQAANAPDAPVSVQIAATGTAGQFSVTITPGAWNGNAPNEVSWYWNSGQIAVSSASQTQVVGTVNGAPNGQTQTISVHGVSAVSQTAGPATTSNAGKPWGPLLGYTPNSSVNGSQVCFSWDVSGALDGQTLTSLTYSAQGGQSGAGGVTGSACSGSAYYTTFGFTMTVNTAEGKSATYTANGSTGANPGRWVNLAKGNQYVGGVTTGSCTAAAPGCYYFHVTAGGFQPNSQVTVGCYNDTSGSPWKTVQVGVDGGGSIDTQLCPIGSAYPTNSWRGPYQVVITDPYGSKPSNTTSW